MNSEYESICIINSKAKNINQIKQKIKEVFNENGGIILNVNDIGIKKLAYKIKNETIGYYYFLKVRFKDYKSNPISKPSIKLNTIEEIIKYIIIRTDNTEKN